MVLRAYVVHMKSCARLSDHPPWRRVVFGPVMKVRVSVKPNLRPWLNFAKLVSGEKTMRTTAAQPSHL